MKLFSGFNMTIFYTCETFKLKLTENIMLIVGSVLLYYIKLTKNLFLWLKNNTSLKRLMSVATDDLAEELPGRLSADVPVVPPRSKVT